MSNIHNLMEKLETSQPQRPKQESEEDPSIPGAFPTERVPLPPARTDTEIISPPVISKDYGASKEDKSKSEASSPTTSHPFFFTSHCSQPFMSRTTRRHTLSLDVPPPGRRLSTSYGDPGTSPTRPSLESISSSPPKPTRAIPPLPEQPPSQVHPLPSLQEQQPKHVTILRQSPQAQQVQPSPHLQEQVQPQDAQSQPSIPGHIPDHELWPGTHHVDMPSTEVPSGSLGGVGVGSLPGQNTEEAVALLPEERKLETAGEEKITHHGHRHHHTHHIPDHELWPGAHHIDMPSSEKPSGSLGGVGVGSLPGDKNEEGVALLPEERQPKGESQKAHTTHGFGHHHHGHHHIPDHELWPGTSHHVDMPSTEVPSGSLGGVGVGSLPGRKTEEGVALLPDEREQEHIHPHRRGHGHGHRHAHIPDHELWPGISHHVDMPSTERPSGPLGGVGVGSLPGNMSEEGVALLPDERGEGKKHFEHGGHGHHGHGHIPDHELWPGKVHHVDLPTKEFPSGSIGGVGVGSLPGWNTEAGVARTPEERKLEHLHHGHIHHHAHQHIPDHELWPGTHHVDMPSTEHPSGSLGGVGVGSLPGRNTEEGVAITPEERKIEHIEPHGHGHGHVHTHHRIPDHELWPGGRHIDLPSTERPSGSLGGVGVGSLPGSNTEAGVARTPEERKLEQAMHPWGTGIGHHHHHRHAHIPDHELWPGANRHVDMPSTEHPSGSLGGVGVGSLPGNNNEAGVAILPDERKAEHLSSQHHLHIHHHGHSVGHRIPDHELWPGTNHQVDMPSTEKPSGSLGGVGVGSLPGPTGEVGVALLPDERRMMPGKHHKNHIPDHALWPGKSHHVDMPSKEKPSGPLGGVGVGSLPGDITEEGVALLPDERVGGDVTIALGDAKIVAAAHEATSASTIREKGPHRPGLREEPLTIFNADEKAELSREEEEERREGQRRGEERMKMMEDTVHRVEEAASNVFHEAATVMHEVEEVVEEVAEEIYHGAERVLHDAGEKAKAYVPASVGAYLPGRDRGRTVTGPGDESVEEITIAGTTIPLYPREEWHLKPTLQYNESGQRVVLNEQGEEEVVEEEESEEEGWDGYGGMSSKEGRGKVEKGMGSEQRVETVGGRPGVEVGYGGVEFRREAGDQGVLPGYPTPEGMRTLVSDRMRDDRLRAMQGFSPSASPSESGASTRAVRGSVSDLGSGRSTPAALLAEPEAAAIGVYSVAGEIPDEDIASTEPLLGPERAAEAKEKEKEKTKKSAGISILGTPVTEEEIGRRAIN